MWRDIPGYEGFYQVSPDGEVRSVAREVWQQNRPGRSAYARHFQTRLLKPSPDFHGYASVTLHAHGRKATKGIHKLVALVFIGPPPDGHGVRHLDGDRSNPRLSNLVYSTQKVNLADRLIHGTHNRGERHAMAKIVEADVLEIRRRAALGERHADIGHDYDLTQSGVWRIVRRKTWPHI